MIRIQLLNNITKHFLQWKQHISFPQIPCDQYNHFLQHSWWNFSLLPRKFPGVPCQLLHHLPEIQTKYISLIHQLFFTWFLAPRKSVLQKISPFILSIWVFKVTINSAAIVRKCLNLLDLDKEKVSPSEWIISAISISRWWLFETIVLISDALSMLAQIDGWPSSADFIFMAEEKLWLFLTVQILIHYCFGGDLLLLFAYQEAA